MKKTIYIVCFLCVLVANAQSALHNTGNIQIHADGQIGFHTNLINNAAFDENLGLAGFYGDELLQVFGAFAPTFYDIEIASADDVILNTSLNTINNTNFISGNFFTPRAQPDLYFNFLENSFYTGSGDISKVDGYVLINNEQNFTFPVGDINELRQLILESEAVNVQAKCAYFREDANNPFSFSRNFNTNTKPPRIGPISTTEFWRVEGSVPSTITISWNENSSIIDLVDDPEKLGIVGWQKSTRRWDFIPVSPPVGDLTQGFISTASFIPDDYEIITFGNVVPDPTELIDTGNYLITPNGDGVNDVLIIPELEQSPNNFIQIFDRYGLKVFEMENYTNQFNGFATNSNFVVAKDKGLPAGIYFYIVSLDDLDLDFQGFLYLAR